MTPEELKMILDRLDRIIKLLEDAAVPVTVSNTDPFIHQPPSAHIKENPCTCGTVKSRQQHG